MSKERRAISTTESHKKGILTPADAAKVCSCSPQTILREFDDGKIAGFRRRTFRKIFVWGLAKYMLDVGLPIQWLISFMEENEIPLSLIADYLPEDNKPKEVIKIAQ